MFCCTGVYVPLWNILDVDFIFSEKLFWPVYYLNLVLSFTKWRLFRAASGLIRGLNTHTLVGDHPSNLMQGREILTSFFLLFVLLHCTRLSNSYLFVPYLWVLPLRQLWLSPTVQWRVSRLIGNSKSKTLTLDILVHVDSCSLCSTWSTWED